MRRNWVLVREEALIARGKHESLGGYERYALIAVLCLGYLHAPDYIHTLNEAILPKYLFFAFGLAIAPLVLANPRLTSLYLVSPFALWAVTLIGLNLAHLGDALINGEPSRASLIGTRIEYLALATLLGLACSADRAGSFERIFPYLAVAIAALVLWDFLSPGAIYPVGTDGSTPGRAAATFINPNKAGEAILITFLLALPRLRPRYRAALLLLVTASVIVTFSRADIIGLTLLWAYLLATRIVPKYTLALPLLLALFSLSLGGFDNYLSGREDISEGLANIEARLAFFQDQALDDASAVERAHVVEGGMELFRQNPLFGAGAGTTFLWPLEAGTHNLLVMLGAEYGLLGIGMWAWLVVILWRGRHFRDRRLQAAMAMWFVFVSMFTHNPFDDLYWLLTFAVVSAQRRS